MWTDRLTEEGMETEKKDEKNEGAPEKQRHKMLSRLSYVSGAAAVFFLLFFFFCLFVCFYISWNSNTLDAWYEELTHWKRPWCWERLKAGGEGTNVDEMVGWHHQLDGHAFEQAPGVGDRQGSLACCSPWGHKELDMTERPNWNERLFFTNLQSHLLLCWFNHIYAFLTELNCQPLHDSWFM